MGCSAGQTTSLGRHAYAPGARACFKHVHVDRADANTSGLSPHGTPLYMVPGRAYT